MQSRVENSAFEVQHSNNGCGECSRHHSGREAVVNEKVERSNMFKQILPLRIRKVREKIHQLRVTQTSAPWKAGVIQPMKFLKTFPFKIIFLNNNGERTLEP